MYVSSSTHIKDDAWHARNKNIDGKVCHAPNSKTWQQIDNTWLDFATKPKNVRLGLATDGVNPFKEQKQCLVHLASITPNL